MRISHYWEGGVYHCGGWRDRPERRGVVTSDSRGIGFLSGRSCGVEGLSPILLPSAVAVGVWNPFSSSSDHGSRVVELRVGDLRVGDLGRGTPELRR